MIALSSFVPKVLESVSGQAAFVVEQRLIGTLRDFCNTTLCWQKTIEVTVDAITKKTQVALPDDAVLVKLMQSMDADLPVYQNNEFLFNPIDGQLKWQSCYLPSGPLTLVLALKPTSNAQQVPEFLFEHFGDAIAGKAATTFAGKSDMPQYKVYELNEQYNDALLAARDLALNGSARIAPKVKHTFF